jgi:hypothetical protein
MYDFVNTSSFLLDKDECAELIEFGLTVGYSQAHNLNSLDQKYLDLNHRSCEVVWIRDELPFYEINSKLKTWTLNFAENIIKADHNNQWIFQIAKYGEGNFHDWHVDDHQDRTFFRKFVTIVQLSDPSSYEGGNLELNNQSNVDKQQGSCVSFLTTRRHRVTPITSGTRYSLVVWLLGPPWR